jgi:hypothetical protein
MNFIYKRFRSYIGVEDGRHCSRDRQVGESLDARSKQDSAFDESETKQSAPRSKGVLLIFATW